MKSNCDFLNYGPATYFHGILCSAGVEKDPATFSLVKENCIMWCGGRNHIFFGPSFGFIFLFASFSGILALSGRKIVSTFFDTVNKYVALRSIYTRRRSYFEMVR